MDTTIITSLVHTSCCNCHVLFGLEESHEAHLRNTGKQFYCPNGHTLVFRDNELARARKERDRAIAEADQARADAAYQRERAEKNERKRSATAGHLTRVKNRIACGVCPCCNRSFQNLARHMQGKHPDYAHKVGGESTARQHAGEGEKP